MEAIEKAAVPGGESGERPHNRRSHPRYTVDEESKLLLVSHGLSVPSHILDLSLEGCRLRTRERHTLLKRMRVEVTFKVNGIAFRFMGVIQWTDGKQYVGIRFVDVIARRRELLTEVIAEIEAAAAVKASKEAAEREAQQAEESAKQAPGQQPEKSEPQPKKPGHQPAAQQLENQVTGQADDLAASQQRERVAIQQAALNSKLAEAVATAQADPLAAILDRAPVKRDRRAQARHAVDTSATISLVKIGSKLSGRILDLSLGGCRIRTDERFPVGIYTRIETEFRLEGLPFRLGGVVQAIHDRHNVGIRFLDVSNRKREQVEQLIEEIAGQGSKNQKDDGTRS